LGQDRRCCSLSICFFHVLTFAAASPFVDRFLQLCLVMCFIKIEGEVHCVGVPARAAAGCGPPGGHKGRPYEGERLADPSI
jgi:hypothetical protein